MSRHEGGGELGKSSFLGKGEGRGSIEGSQPEYKDGQVTTGFGL